METQLEMCIRTIKSFGFEIPVDNVEYRGHEPGWFKNIIFKNEILFFKDFKRFFCIIRINPHEDRIRIKIYSGSSDSDSIGPPLPDEKKLIDFINYNTGSTKQY